MTLLVLLSACEPAPPASTPASAPASTPASTPAAAPARTSMLPSGHASIQPMVLVPAGEFTMGTDPSKEPKLEASFGLKRVPYEAEAPVRKLTLDAYYIDLYEVTLPEFVAWAAGSGTPVPEAIQKIDVAANPRYPAMSMTWAEADAYCRARGARLPTESEWEKAARGTDGRKFPWGETYDGTKTNNSNEGTTPVGYFAADKSPYGVLDMGGNVFEWVDGWYEPYPGNEDPDPEYGQTHRVMRGGTWGGRGHYNLDYYARAASRQPMAPDSRFTDLGFRCARSATPADGAPPAARVDR